jgi:hypothetical protein
MRYISITTDLIFWSVISGFYSSRILANSIMPDIFHLGSSESIWKVPMQIFLIELSAGHLHTMCAGVLSSSSPQSLQFISAVGSLVFWSCTAWFRLIRACPVSILATLPTTSLWQCSSLDAFDLFGSCKKIFNCWWSSVLSTWFPRFFLNCISIRLQAFDFASRGFWFPLLEVLPFLAALSAASLPSCPTCALIHRSSTLFVELNECIASQVVLTLSNLTFVAAKTFNEAWLSTRKRIFFPVSPAKSLAAFGIASSSAWCTVLFAILTLCVGHGLVLCRIKLPDWRVCRSDRTRSWEPKQRRRHCPQTTGQAEQSYPGSDGHQP